mmetsp:Transcript_1292/g.1729  ORF Transcript_1292/g.1729 Transcript_1292/m.1729 type:complete len:392 (-) Transcript_1292:74-1249(-)
MSSQPSDLYVVQVDSRRKEPNDWSAFKESTVPSNFFELLPNSTVVFDCIVASEYGIDLKLYFVKSKRGLSSDYKSGGGEAVLNRTRREPTLLASNNGAASFLTLDPATGLTEYIVCGRAYLVQDDGKSPLSKGQVWGYVEMVNCLMDIYDIDPWNIEKGRQTLKQWAKQYKKQQWEPPTGAGGVNLYSSRSKLLPSSADTTHPPSAASESSNRNQLFRGTELQKALLNIMIVSASKLMECIECDMYPDAETEKIFGIDMGSGDRRCSIAEIPLGNLVYSVWTEIFSFHKVQAMRGLQADGEVNAALQAAKKTLSNQVANAIINENLPADFYEWTKQVSQSDDSFPTKNYSKEFMRREFDPTSRYVNPASREHVQWMDRIRQVNQDAATNSH